jgi:flavin-dependent dehydrogenase
VIIIGAGPAGCSAAINVNIGKRLAIIDSVDNVEFKIGESLPPASKRLFQTMGLWEEFLLQGHLPCYGNRAVWDSEEFEETDFIKDIDGNGWHIDRAQFENWLRGKVKQQDNVFYAPARFVAAKFINECWQLDIEINQKITTLKTKCVIDATGRNAAFARHIKIPRQHLDKMVCTWVKGREIPQQADAGFSVIHAVKEGWWYSAAIPDNQRILSFHTEAKLDGTKKFKSTKEQLQAAQKIPKLADILQRCHFRDNLTWGYTAAHSAKISEYSGQSWLAIGDAAMCMDPISSQGMFNGLYTGLLAAQETLQFLDNKINNFDHYNARLDNIWNAYLSHLKYYYGAPSQWRNSEFWVLKSQQHKPENGL